jgi:hypothetical protein
MMPSSQQLERTTPLRVEGTDLFDWKGMVHCHSHHSHDSDGTIEEITAAAKSAGTRFVVMTDHQTPDSIALGQRGEVDGVLYLCGAELRTAQGTVLAFPLQRPLRRWMHCGALVAEAKQQGALVFVGHAEAWKDWNMPGLAGAEIVNLHAGAMTANPAAVIGSTLLLPARQLMRMVAMRDDAVFLKWDEQLVARHPFTPVGGGDAHANIQAFGPLGGTIAGYPEVFLSISTHVLTRERTEAAIIDAMRRGRVYVSFDVNGEGTGFDFRAQRRDGAIALPGDTIAASECAQLRVATPAAAQIRFFCNGRLVAQKAGPEASLRDPEPGVYRVEAWTESGAPWLFSSSIRLAAAEPATQPSAGSAFQ